MSGVLACIAAALVGVDYGWRPLPGGGMEYIIQVEPGTREALRSDEAIESDVPPEVRDVRHFRFVVGTKKLPRDLPAGSAGPAAGPRPAAIGALGPLRPNPMVPSLPPLGPASSPSPAAAGSPSDAGKDASKPAAGDNPGPAEPAQTWLPTWAWAATLLCCASLGGNVYLAWIACGIRKRCRAMLQAE
jgi:hypothetical protein